MHLSLRHVYALVAAQSLAGVLGDFSGPGFPAPKDLTSDQSLVGAAWKSVTATLEAAGLGGGSINNSGNRPNGSLIPGDVQNTTFSIGLISLHDPDAASLQFHHTSPEIAASTQGTKKVDGNSIYRIASITKVFTVLAGLLTLSDAEWERPLSDILAPLSAGRDIRDSVLSTPWDKVTMRVLAAQIGGVPRDGFPGGLGEIALQMVLTNMTEAELMAQSGLPAGNMTDPLSNPPCLVYLLRGEACPETAYLEGVANRAPTFLPWTTPGYTNNGFTLLGLAMANVTGQTIGRLYQDNILAPLDMKSTFSDPPPTAEYPRSVIIGDDAVAGGFAVANGIFVSSGGVFSTTRDLARFGTGILNSTLLAPAQTRRWLKPVSHTARLQYAVGAPWEIVRYVSPATGKATDLYTKSGDSGSYSSWLVLLPDYGFGFSILSAGSARSRFRVVAALADTITHALVPALEAQAAAEAARNLAGVYRAASGSGLNSSLVLTAADATPGVVVSSWVSNGTDVLAYLPALVGPGPYRLLPSVVDSVGGQIALRLVGAADATSAQETPGALFSAPGMLIADWLVVDASTYYGAGLSLFVFDVGRDGRATVVTLPAYRVTLCDQLTPSCSRCARLGIHCTGSGERRYKFVARPDNHSSQRAPPTTGAHAESSIASSTTQLVPTGAPSNQATLDASSFLSALQVTDVRFDLRIYGPFFTEIPRRLGRNEALDASVRALTTAFPSVHTHQHTPDMYKTYGEALRHLRASLGDPATAASVETLCAVYLIMICQGWIGRGADFFPSHGEAMAYMLNAATASRHWQGDFEAEIANTLLVLTLLESFGNHKIKLDPRLWAAEDTPAVARPSRPPADEAHHIECLQVSSLAAVSGFTRDVQGSLPAIRSTYEVLQTDLAKMKALLSEVSTTAASDLTLSERRIHVRRQTGYGTLLLLGMMANWALGVYGVGGNPLALELERTMLVDEVVELARQASQYRPLGSSAMPGFIMAAKITTDDAVRLGQLEELLALYQSDFPSSK
ncbi:beta-lactamase/transpeptidase-like protein [Lasiosphaeria hispida]|uniref:Beta-lactamase/transpeptidase-like protein n=1 Tax=Lasiosphaeria hispida TaxID=260671 RepID=A0AAJ0HME4_9PEZI|nr:beta-lactamase/transpeptidase-like protein [Lasiosphaeria hispida]